VDIDSATPGLRRSTRRTAPKVSWWEKDPKAYLASGAKSASKDFWDFTKPRENEKEARALPEWTLWNNAIKDEVVSREKLGI